MNGHSKGTRCPLPEALSFWNHYDFTTVFLSMEALKLFDPFNLVRVIVKRNLVPLSSNGYTGTVTML